MSQIYLPPEIYSMIFKLTGPHPSDRRSIVSKNTFYSLARCSHEFYQLAMPLLYENVELGRIYSKIEYSGLQLRHLTCLLLEKPDLAFRVRRFSIFTGLSYGLESQREEERGRESKVLEVPENFKSIIRASSHSTDEVQL